MLDEKDLYLLKKMMEDVVARQLTESENLLLDEVGRTRKILEEKIEKVEKNLEELEQYYRITRLESDNTSLLLQLVTGLQKRVTELEKKSA